MAAWGPRAARPVHTAASAQRHRLRRSCTTSACEWRQCLQGWKESWDCWCRSHRPQRWQRTRHRLRQGSQFNGAHRPQRWKSTRRSARDVVQVQARSQLRQGCRHAVVQAHSQLHASPNPNRSGNQGPSQPNWVHSMGGRVPSGRAHHWGHPMSLLSSSMLRLASPSFSRVPHAAFNRGSRGRSAQLSVPRSDATFRPRSDPMYSNWLGHVSERRALAST